MTIESASSQPANRPRNSGIVATTPAYAASTWNQIPSRRAIFAISAIGSLDVVDVVPTVPTRAIGRIPVARSVAMASSSASIRSSKRSFVGIFVRPARPRPRVMQALAIDEWASSEA